MTITPMAYHGPGWETEHEGITYQVWAPSAKRAYWAAAWQGSKGITGAHVRGESLLEVSSLFPPEVAQMFLSPTP